MARPRYRLDFWHALDGWRWRVIAGNNRTIAESGEAFDRRSDARKSYRRARAAMTGLAV